MDTQPTRISAGLFHLKVLMLRARRGLRNYIHPITRHSLAPQQSFPFLATRSITSLWTDSAPAEQWYQRGKVVNLRLAAARIDGCIVPEGEVFSFWQQVGRASSSDGYQPGRMLQEGCIIPSAGGGLCQLSNALYQVALDSGCEILERHGHSRIVPGSATAAGRDATVAWNYVDLRFRAPQQRQLRVELTGEHLMVSMFSNVPVSPAEIALQPLAVMPIGADHACDTCGQAACFRKHELPQR